MGLKNGSEEGASSGVEINLKRERRDKEMGIETEAGNAMGFNLKLCGRKTT